MKTGAGQSSGFHMRPGFYMPSAFHIILERPDFFSTVLYFAKAIANIAFREDIPRASWIIFYFLSKLVDQDPHIFTFVSILGPPNGSQEAMMRNGATGVLHKITE